MPTASEQISSVDPRSPEAQALVAALSAELAARYDHVDDGSGELAAEDVFAPGGAFLVLRVADLAVGCGALRPVDPETAEIKRLFVRSAYRRRGYAATILQTLELVAAQAGFSRVRLETGDRLVEAIALYVKSGYLPIPSFPPYQASARSRCFQKVLER
jgi:putative acetyltransferase